MHKLKKIKSLELSSPFSFFHPRDVTKLVVLLPSVLLVRVQMIQIVCYVRIGFMLHTQHNI